MGIICCDCVPFYPSASGTLAELLQLGRYSKEILFRSVPQVPQAPESSSRHPTCILHSIPASISAIFQGFFCIPPFSHDHSSLSNDDSNDPHAPFDDFQCML